MGAVNLPPFLIHCRFFPFRIFLLFFSKRETLNRIFISAITGPLLKRVASGNTLTVIIIQNTQKHGSELQKNFQGWMTKYCSFLHSQLSASLPQTWEFRSSTWVQMLLTSRFTRERMSDKCLYLDAGLKYMCYGFYIYLQLYLNKLQCCAWANHSGERPMKHEQMGVGLNQWTRGPWKVQVTKHQGLGIRMCSWNCCKLIQNKTQPH